MKLTRSITSLLALFCVQSSLLAQEDAKKEVKVQPKVIIKSIQANDKESVGAAIAKAIGEMEKGDTAGGINLDGILKIETNEEGEGPAIKLEGGYPKFQKAIDKALKNAQNLKATVFIGADGKVTELKDGEGLSDAIDKMIKGISPKDGNVMKIGPAFFNGAGGEMKKEIRAIKKEQAEQRKLLEAILKKLK